jgi:ankyrin repeat protein
MQTELKDKLIALNNKVEVQEGISIQKLINSDNIDARIDDLYNGTALHTIENCQIIQILLNYKANFQALNSCDFSPLNSAISSANFNKVQTLITHKAEVNTSDKCPVSPLITAIVVGNKEIISLLLHNKTRIELKHIEEAQEWLTVAQEGALEQKKIQTRQNALELLIQTQIERRQHAAKVAFYQQGLKGGLYTKSLDGTNKVILPKDMIEEIIKWVGLLSKDQLI